MAAPRMDRLTFWAVPKTCMDNFGQTSFLAHSSSSPSSPSQTCSRISIPLTCTHLGLHSGSRDRQTGRRRRGEEGRRGWGHFAGSGTPSPFPAFLTHIKSLVGWVRFLGWQWPCCLSPPPSSSIFLFPAGISNFFLALHPFLTGLSLSSIDMHEHSILAEKLHALLKSFITPEKEKGLPSL